MGKWTLQHTDEILLCKMRKFIMDAIDRHSEEKPREGEARPVTYEMFVEMLDSKDSFSSKLIEILVKEFGERNARRTPVDRQLYIASRTAQSLSLLPRSANIYPDSQPRPTPAPRGRRPWLEYEPTTLRLPRVMFPPNPDGSRATRGREPILGDIVTGNPWTDMPDEELDDATVDLTTDGAEFGARLDSNLYDALAPSGHFRRSVFSATTSETGVPRRASPDFVEGVDEPGEDQENEHESLHGLSEAALARLFDFEPALDENGLSRFRVERGTRDGSTEMDRSNLDSSIDLSTTGGSGEGTSAASASASAASSSSTTRGLFPRRPPSAGGQPFRQSSVRRNRFRVVDNSSMRRRLANRDLGLVTAGAGSAWARWEVDSDDGQPGDSFYATRMSRRPHLGGRSGPGVENHFQEMRIYRRQRREEERDSRRNWAAADSNADADADGPSASASGAGPPNVPPGLGPTSTTTATVTPTAVGPAGLYFHPDNPPIETTGLTLSPPPEALDYPIYPSLRARRRVEFPFPPRDVGRDAYYRDMGSSYFETDEPHADEVDELVALEIGHSPPMPIPIPMPTMPTIPIPRGPTPGFGAEGLAAPASQDLSAVGEEHGHGRGIVPGEQLAAAYSNAESSSSSNSRVRGGPGSAGATPRAPPFRELVPDEVDPIGGLEGWRQSSPQQQSSVSVSVPVPVPVPVHGRQLLRTPSREDEADAALVAALLQG